jgi:lipoprotein-releasing system permease protein
VSLVLDIAWTHVRARARQTFVGVFGVAVGVGFSVMMASLMEGSQRDFIRQLVDALPHITVTDDRRAPPVQPAEEAYAAVQISGLTTEQRRRGIKNPYAIMASLEGWVPGAVAPSVKSTVLIRVAGRDFGATLTGIDPRREPRVSQLATQMRQGGLEDLYKASNAIILGSGLAQKLGARVGNTIAVASGQGRPVAATVVGIFHSGVRQMDETQAYGLVRTGQVLAGQTGLVNELRVRVADVLGAREVAQRIETQTGYKSVSWQEANEDLLSAFTIRNFIMYTVVGAILLVASFGTYNIISTITHEKTRDIAIMKSLGLREATVRRIFVVEALMIGAAGMVLGWALGYLMCLGLGQVEFRNPFGDATRLPLYYAPLHYVIAGAIALGASLFAAYFPARKAARVHPVEIIRGAS